MPQILSSAASLTTLAPPAIVERRVTVGAMVLTIAARLFQFAPGGCRNIRGGDGSRVRWRCRPV